jgi:hypothetical protein
MEAVGISAIQDLTDKYRLYGVCNSCHRMDRLNLLTLAVIGIEAHFYLRGKTRGVP